MDNVKELMVAAMSSAVDKRFDDVHVAMPGRVEAYDPASQTATVQPLIQVRDEDEDGNLVPSTHPTIHSVPVVFPGGGGFRVTFPISRGDTVLLVFSEAALDQWKQRDGVVDPRDDREHHLRDAIAIPGLRSIKRALAKTSITSATIGKDDGPQIELGISDIKIGGSLSQPTLLATTFLSSLGTLLTALGAFAATCATTPPGAPADLVDAITAFGTAAATYTSVIAKVT